MLISVNRKDKAEVVEVARSFHEDGFKILATGNTYELIHGSRHSCGKVKKLYEGRPNILDLITNGKIDLIVNSPVGKDSVHDDSYLRKAAIKGQDSLHDHDRRCKGYRQRYPVCKGTRHGRGSFASVAAQRDQG